MKGSTGETHIGSEEKLHEYISDHTGTPTKAKSKNKVGLGVPEYIISEVIEKDKC